MLEKFSACEEVVVCLHDDKYHYGVGALANSLANSNFKGLMHVGFKDALPPWISQLRMIDDNCYYLTNDIIIQFDHVKTDMHLAYYKPHFIKSTFNKFPSVAKLFYFDSDIVINAPWNFFSNWLDGDVCLCLDNSFEFVHFNHPWRKDWKKLADIQNDLYNPTTFYVNSGFIGIQIGSIRLIDKWIELTEKYVKQGGDIKEINQSGHNSYKGDQDLLNAAITVSPEIHLSIIGKEGMGFTQPAYLMSHSITKDKPWSKNFLKYLIKTGHKPSYVEKSFFFYIKHPINLFSKTKFLLKKSNLLIASVLGRYIGN